MSTRRGFLGALAALFAAPLAKFRKPSPAFGELYGAVKIRTRYTCRVVGATPVQTERITLVEP